MAQLAKMASILSQVLCTFDCWETSLLFLLQVVKENQVDHIFNIIFRNEIIAFDSEIPSNIHFDPFI